jgi:hypothetical protein
MSCRRAWTRITGEVESVEGPRVRIEQRVMVGDRVAVEPAWTELEMIGS